MTTGSVTSVLLLNWYRKGSKTVQLKPHPYDADFRGGMVDLSPVLYHGTSRARILQWHRELGIRGEKFSTTSSPNLAAVYAIERKASQVVIGADLEWRSIAFFDRDALLAFSHSGLDRHQDVENGLLLQWQPGIPEQERMLPVTAMIASLDFHSVTKHTEFHIFNRGLWEENFSQDNPDIERARFHAQLGSPHFPLFCWLVEELFGRYSP